MKKLFLPIITLFILLFTTSCTTKANNEIITSSFPIYDLTTRIAGDKMTVKNLVKAGIEPHDYEPSTQDVASLIECKLFIANGLGLEHYTSELTKDITDKMYICTEGITTLYTTNNTADPHAWLNPLNAIKMMENIKNKLSSIDEANASYYTENFEANKALFLELDESYKAELTNLKSTYLVTAHAAFTYLCDAYGLTQLPISGISPDDEPTAQAIANLINQIKDLNVTTIFSEELVSDAVAKSIASQTGLVCSVLSPIEGLEDESSTDNYLTLMESNLVEIVKALK